jgi:hypothetical protein
MTLNNEFERIRKEIVVAQFKILSRQTSAGTDEMHEKY